MKADEANEVARVGLGFVALCAMMSTAVAIGAYVLSFSAVVLYLLAVFTLWGGIILGHADDPRQNQRILLVYAMANGFWVGVGLGFYLEAPLLSIALGGALLLGGLLLAAYRPRS